jgi:homing endonuclease-like protein
MPDNARLVPVVALAPIFGPAKRSKSVDADSSISSQSSPKRLKRSHSFDFGSTNISSPVASPSVQIRPLKVLSVPRNLVISVVEQLSAGKSRSSQQKNQYLTPILRSLSDSQLLFPQEVGTKGHCRALYQKTRNADGTIVEIPKLLEGGSNSDHPRYGIDNAKYPVYHLVALHKALTAPDESMSLELLFAVSSDKSDKNAKTILHHCGHKFCNAPTHLSIGSKILNDEMVACHRMLQSAKNAFEFEMVQKYACRHQPACWTILYDGLFKDSVSWAIH